MYSNRIVFIEPPVSLEEIYGGLGKVGAISPPLNILLLAAIVRKKGYEPHIFDCPAIGLSDEDVVNRLQVIKPKFVGVTAMTPHIVQAGRLARLIKERFPDIIILLGGAHVSSVPEETMWRFPEFDIGFIGEADYSLLEVLAALNRGDAASSIKGTISREGGKLVNTGQRIDTVKLDTLPWYAWDILEGFPHMYRTPLFATHRTPATAILTSRGCPSKCIFCYSGCHSAVSTYSAEYIIEMLIHLKKRYGIKEFMMYDDNFVMFKQNLKRFLDALINKGLDLTWSCNARVDMLNEEMLYLMARAGCWQISYGVETGNQKIMNLIGKNITKEKIIQTLQLTRQAGIRTVGYFMIGHFEETQETIDETIEFACSAGLDDFRMSFFTPLPGTKSYSMADKYGDFESDWGKMNLFSPVFIPKGLTKERLIYNQRKAMRKFFMRPRIIWSYLTMVKKPLTALRGAYQFARYCFHVS